MTTETAQLAMLLVDIKFEISVLQGRLAHLNQRIDGALQASYVDEDNQEATA